MADTPLRSPSPHEDQQPKDQSSRAPVNIERLADRVYRLMVNDLRLERARGVKVVRRQGG